MDGLCDVVGFVTDISSSTFSLLDVYPAAGKPLHLSGKISLSTILALKIALLVFMKFNVINY